MMTKKSVEANYSFGECRLGVHWIRKFDSFLAHINLWARTLAKTCRQNFRKETLVNRLECGKISTVNKLFPRQFGKGEKPYERAINDGNRQNYFSA